MLAQSTVLDGRRYPVSAGLMRLLPERDYHRGLMVVRGEDGAEVLEESLSYSRAKLLIPPSTPAHFQGQVWQPRHEFDFGRAAHRRVLGAGAEYEILPSTGWLTDKGEEAKNPALTKAYKQRKAEIEAAGLTPVSEKDAAIIDAMEVQLRDHMTALDLLTGDGDAEVSMWGQDPQSQCWLRGRMDYWNRDQRLIVDYKTTKSAAPAYAGTQVWKYHYELQAAWYLTVAGLAGIDAAGFVFIMQEKKPPYAVSVVRLDEASLNVGREEMRACIDAWVRCRASGMWPAYADEVVTVGLPRWAYATGGVDTSEADALAQLLNDEGDE